MQKLLYHQTNEQNNISRLSILQNIFFDAKKYIFYIFFLYKKHKIYIIIIIIIIITIIIIIIIIICHDLLPPSKGSIHVKADYAHTIIQQTPLSPIY